MENSLAAFRLAKELGADGVELDVHSTADGALIVHHDEQIGRQRVGDLRLHDVRTHQLGNGEPIPTLEAALQVILPAMYAYVEIKSLDPRWDHQLLAMFDASPAPDRIAIHSFDHRIVRRLGELRPALPRGVLLSAYVMEPAQVLRAAAADTLWQRFNHVDRSLVDAVHGAGTRLIAWTVDEPAELHRLLELEVDGLCSNHPDRARQAIDSRPQ